jgi:predicted RNA-binding protein with RPS1 domain
VKAGQIVKVKVLNADAKTKRIALSIKALQGGPPQRDQKPTPQLATVDSKLAFAVFEVEGHLNYRARVPTAKRAHSIFRSPSVTTLWDVA